MNRNSAGIKKAGCFLLFVICTLFIHASLLAQKNDIKETKIEKQGKSHSITVSYPQMLVPKDALMGVRGTIGDFNRPIEDIVNKRIAEFMAGIDPTDSTAKYSDNTLNILYETYTDTKNIYSIKFESFSEIYHSAHPNSVFDSYNFSFDSWNPFTVRDIFNDTVKSLKMISDYCIADLKKQAKETNNEPPEEISKGASANWENFKTFNVSGDRLLITFQYYQCGPRPFGAPVVSMPLAKLKDLIDLKGPLGYMK